MLTFIGPIFLHQLAAIHHIKRGIAQMRLMNYQSAVFYFKKAIDFDPDSYVPYVGMASAILAQKQLVRDVKNLDHSIEILLKAKEINSTDGKIYFLLGKAYSLKRELDSAIQNLKIAVRLKSDLPQYYQQLGYVYKMKNQNQDALHAYLRAAQLSTIDHQQICLNLASLLRQKKREVQAIRFQQKLVAICPNTQEYHQSLGIMLMQVYRFKQAIKYFQRAIHLANLNKQQPDVDIVIRLADLYFHKAQFKRAISLYQNAAKILPNDFILSNKLGKAYKKSNRKVKSKNLYFRALQLNPKSPQAHLIYGLSLEYLNQNQEAAQQYCKAIDIDPSYFAPYEHLGNLHEKVDQKQQAIECYLKAINFNKNSEVSLRRLFELMILRKKYKQAVQYSLTCIEFTIQFVKPFWNSFFLNTQQVSQQMRDLHKKLQKFIVDLQAYHTLGQILYQMNLIEEATEILTRAMGLQMNLRRMLQQIKIPFESLIDCNTDKLIKFKYFWPFGQLPFAQQRKK